MIFSKILTIIIAIQFYCQDIFKVTRRFSQRACVAMTSNCGFYRYWQ